MPSDLKSLQSAIRQEWRKIASNPIAAAQRIGTRSAHGLLIAATFLPLLAVYTANPSDPTIFALLTVASNTGSKLLANFVQETLNKNLSPSQVEKLALEDPEIQEALDILLEKSASILIAQQEWGIKWAQFLDQLKKEFGQLTHSPRSSVIVNSRTIVTGAGVAAPTYIVIQSGGQFVMNINGSVSYPDISTLTVYPATINVGER